MIQTEPLVSISLFVEKARRAGEETRKIACGERERGFLLWTGVCVV